MKKIIIASIFALSTNAMAFDMGNVSFDTPSASDWALTMVKMTCDVDSAQLKGATGIVKKQDDGSVLYFAVSGDEVIATAKASSSYIWAKKSCL